MARGRWGDAMRQVRALLNEGAVGGLTDGELLGRFASRDGEAAEAAFAALVDRHGPMVLRACRAAIVDEHEAQDAFQATFLVLARKASSLRVRDSLAPWLHAVAHRVGSRARTNAARRRGLERKAAERAPRDVNEGDRDDLGPAIHEEVDRLPARYRAPIVLCYLEGLTHERAAQQLLWPVGTVRTRLSKARELLRARLIRRGLAPSAALAASMAVAEAPAATVPIALASATARGALRFGSGGATAGVVPVSAVLLAEGVLKAMIHSSRLLAGSLIAAGLAATAAGSLAFQAAEPAPKQAERPPADGPKRDDLARRATISARVETARDIVDEDMTRLRERAENNAMDLMVEIAVWSRRLRDDRLLLASTPGDRLAAIREHRDRMVDMERLAGNYAKSGQGRAADAQKLTYYRLEADGLLIESGVDPFRLPPPGRPEPNPGEPPPAPPTPR